MRMSVAYTRIPQQIALRISEWCKAILFEWLADLNMKLFVRHLWYLRARQAIQTSTTFNRFATTRLVYMCTKQTLSFEIAERCAGEQHHFRHLICYTFSRFSKFIRICSVRLLFLAFSSTLVLMGMDFPVAPHNSLFRISIAGVRGNNVLFMMYSS